MRDDRWHGRATGSRWHWLLTLFVSFFVAIAADAATNAQRSFATPDDAVQALVQAIKSNDRAVTLAVLGQDASEWISSGDAAADRVSIAGFVAAYDAKHEIVRDGNKATLTLGVSARMNSMPSRCCKQSVMRKSNMLPKTATATAFWRMRRSLQAAPASATGSTGR